MIGPKVVGIQDSALSGRLYATLKKVPRYDLKPDGGEISKWERRFWLVEMRP